VHEETDVRRLWPAKEEAGDAVQLAKPQRLIDDDGFVVRAAADEERVAGSVSIEFPVR
jgi:hypothetical protein